MAQRPRGSSQPPPVLVPLPTDRSPAFIQTLMRAASESASNGGANSTVTQHQESSPSYHQPPSATAATSTTQASNASSTASGVKDSQTLPSHLPVIRLQQETPSLQGAATAAVVSGEGHEAAGSHDNSNNNSNRSSPNPPLPPRIQAPSSSSSSSLSSLSEKPLPPMPTAIEPVLSAAGPSPSTTFAYQQQQQQQPHLTGVPSVTTATNFALGEHYLGGNNGGNSNNSSGGNESMSSSRQSLDHAPPPYSFTAGNRGSTIISTGPPPPTEDQLFQVQELSPGPLAVSSNSSSSGSGSSTLSSITAHLQSTPYICADPMHDQQYLLVGSGNALHSIDLTFSNHQQHQQGAGSSNSSGTTGGAVTASAVGNVVRTHIQGLAFKEIHCLEEIGLVVVIAGRNSRVRCYDYDAINRLVAYGHSAQGRGRVVDGGKLGAVKNMIQLRVETAFLRQDDQQGTASDGPHSSPPAGMTGASANRASRGTAATATGGATAAGQAPTGIAGTPQQGQQPLRQNRHQHTTSLDRSLLSPPAQSDSPGLPLEPIRDEPDAESSITTGAVPPCATNYRKHKQRPLSFGGLASLTQENVMRKTTPKDPSDTSSNNNSNNNNKIPSATTMASHSTPSSPSSATASGVAIGGINNSNSSITNNTGSSGATPTKNKRLSQMASYLSHAAVSSNMAAHITNAQDAPSEEAVGWAWDFTKLKQTKDVIGLDFHYTTTTVFMTVVSKTAIDIYCRSRSARGRKPPAPTGGFNSNGGNSASRTSYSGAETPGRTSMSSIGSGGMAMATSPENPHLHRDYSLDPYEWKLYKQFYHPEPPSFMTVVKGPTEVTDIILGKGPRACVINVEDMSVTDLHRQETSSVIHGLSRKLGFRNSSLWHSFEKIPFDVPPHILFPAAAEAMYGSGERKGTNSRPLSVYSGGSSGNSNSASSSGGAGGTGGGERRSRDNILQRSSDQQTIHQQELEEQEREEAAHALALKLQNTQLNNNLGVPYHPAHYRGSSSSSPPSSTSSSNSSSSITLPAQQYQQPPSTNVPTSTATATAVTTKTTAAATKTRMVTSDEVLNLAFSQRTTGQLFLATYGSQSRIVDLQGKPQSRVVLDWESAPPQKVAFLKTVHDIYVVGFEKASIVIFSLTRAKKVKEILKRDLIQATARDSASASAPAPSGVVGVGVQVNNSNNGQQRFLYDGTQPHHRHRTTQLSTSPPSNNNNNTAGAQSSLAATAQALTNAATSSSSSSSYSSSLSSSSSASIKFLGRDSMAEDSLGLFFSYCHPKNGVSLCQLAVVPLLAADELELIGYYP